MNSGQATAGSDVDRAFAFVERTYRGTPCRECKGRQTVGTVFQGVVIVSCEACGGGTRIGSLAKLWRPEDTPTVRQRPVLRAPQQVPANGRTVRQWPR